MLGPQLPEDLVREIGEAQEQVQRVAREGREARLTADEVRRAGALSRRVIETLTRVDAAGNPVNEVDRAIVSELASREEEISAEITALNAEGDPQPMDYYEVYYRVLRDSGLVSSSMPDPAILRELIDETGGVEGSMREGNFRVAANCDACNICSICAGCGACSGCAIGLVMGTAGTGALGGTSGTIGSFMVQN
jgi:hypothetical protein